MRPEIERIREEADKQFRPDVVALCDYALGLEADQRDWRKGVELIAAGLGDTNPPNLSCVRIYELALSKSVEIEQLTAANADLQRRLKEAEMAIIEWRDMFSKAMEYLRTGEAMQKLYDELMAEHPNLCPTPADKEAKE